MDSSSVVYNGLVSGDTFTGSYSGVFANANVGTGKTVTITSSYTGADVSNYQLPINHRQLQIYLQKH